MNLIELKADLLSKGYYKIGEVTNAEKSSAGLAIRDAEGVSWKLVGAYVQTGNTMSRINIPVYIENEGTKEETAYYMDKEPESKIVSDEGTNNSFDSDNLKTYLDSQGWIAYELTSTNETQKMAIVKAYVQTDKAAQAKSYLIKQSEKGFSLFNYIEA